MKRKETWAISLNASEIRQLSYPSIVSGDSLPWKAAMWGSQRDLRLITRIERCWPRLRDVASARELVIHPGVELRNEEEQKEPIEPAPEVAGKPILVMTALRQLGRLYSFSDSAFTVIEPQEAFVRSGRAEPVKICRPPHIIVSGARTFAVFSDDYIVVPPRQIGIAGGASQRSFLVALSLYLSSDFAQYYEFFRSPQGGIREGRSTLETLKVLPCPIENLSSSALDEWNDLWAELVALSPSRWLRTRSPLFEDQPERVDQLARLDSLERTLNENVYDLLGLRVEERWLVQDLVQIRRRLTDGNVGEEAARAPEKEEVSAYGETLRQHLDEFVGAERHDVTVVYDSHSGLIEVILALPHERTCSVHVHRADDIVGSELAKLRLSLLVEAGQWIYFDRNLHLYRENRAYLLKPMQRVEWTRSQALLDADEILASNLAPEGS